MNFIAILIALGVETFYKPITALRDYQWFSYYEGWMKAKLERLPFRDSPVAVVIIYGLVFALTAVLATALYDFFGLLGFLFATLVLIYCLGPEDLDDDVEAYLHAITHDDPEAACHHAEKVIGYEVKDKPVAVLHKVKQAIFMQGNSRMLAVLFWFVILGPAGALLFRLSEIQNRQYREQSDSYADAVQRLFDILAWLPARLSIVGYAVVGNFTDTMSKWKSFNDFWEEDTETLMILSAEGALQHEGWDGDAEPAEIDTTDVMEALALVKRTLIFWLAVLGVLTLTGTFF